MILTNEKNYPLYLQLIYSANPHYPIPITEEDAIKYLEELADIDFLLHNGCNYDIVDYPKLIYIECTFQDNETIKNLLIQVKQKIAQNFLCKKLFLERIIDHIPVEDIPELEPWRLDNYYGLPEKIDNNKIQCRSMHE